MIRRKIEIDIKAFPSELHELLRSGDIYDSSSSPEAKTLYCDSGYYIKIARSGELALEAALCRRFHSMGLGVEVLQYISADKDYFVTKSAVGEDLTHFLDDPKKLCQVLASALRKLHSQPLEDAPVSFLRQRYLSSANGDYSGGSFDDFMLMDKVWKGSRDQAWEIMQANKNKLKADTLIHGDACLPNVICHDGKFSTFIDLGLSGAGDKHMDLYWAVWSLQYNLKTDEYTDYFLDQYGRENIDFDMLKVVAAFEAFG